MLLELESDFKIWKLQLNQCSLFKNGFPGNLEQREEEAAIGKAHHGASIALLSTYKSPRFTVETNHSSNKADKLKIAIFRKKKWQVIGWIRVSKSTDRNDFTMIRCYRKLWWVLIIINVNAKMLHVKWCKYYVRFGYFVYSFMFSKSFIIVSTWFSRSHLIGKSDELPIIKKVSKVKCGSCTKMLCDRVIFMSQLKGSFILARNKV